MGLCFTHQNPQDRNKQICVYKVSSNNLNQKQSQILRLIYNDLKMRIPEQALNLQNFLLFFHKNGFWGARLFQQFIMDSSRLITEDQFIDGMAKLSKIDEDKKIQLLFKFFSSASSNPQSCRELPHISDSKFDSNKNGLFENNAKSHHKGVKFEEFLVMLYNYPKEDLKEILNDKEFFQKQIKGSLVSIGQNRRLESIYNLGLPLGKKNSLTFHIDDNSENQTGIEQQEAEVQPSMLGKDILKQLKQREIDQTTLRLKDGDKTLEVKTNNMHHLVKKFAMNIFKSFNLDTQNGQLNLNQFSQWIKQHNTLYKNYYDGFHNQVWQYDQTSKKPMYLTTPSQRQALSRYICRDNVIKSYLLLKHSILIVCQEQQYSNPIEIICLEGLEVTKIFEEQFGYGFLISHRDGYYDNRKIFLKNQAIRDDWNEALKFFKGGTIENSYNMGRKIGTGKFSVVYEAFNKETKTQVAIKVIDFKELDMSARKLIAHQSSIMQIFCHPLLVQFKTCLQTKTHMYIITELCPGKDLFEFVKERKHLSEKQSACIIQQVIVGVRYMHSLGIVHRDLKPENVMVSYDQHQEKVQTVKIIDFGFANYLSTFSEMTPDQILAGTPNYIAPQLLRGEPISYKSDNFAIGSILYFMLSGNLPFNSHSLTDIFSKTLDGNYNFKGKIWQKVDDLAKNLIDRFLQSQPESRITLEQALKHPWFKEVKQRYSKKVISIQGQTQNEGIQSTRQMSK